MTKADLVEQVKKICGPDTGNAQAAAAVEAVFTAMRHELASGGKVTIKGFGSFQVKARAARAGRNPKTGKMISIPAGKRVSFTPGKGLKEAIA